MSRSMRNASLRDFTVLQELGRNATGAVLKAVYKPDGAVYVLKRKYVTDSTSKLMVETEARLLGKLAHPNVVSCYGSFWDDDLKALHIVLEYCEGGDLRGLINRHKGIGIHIDESYIWSTFDQICAGLTHLHRNGVIHRDLKSMNILVADGGDTVKITDLGVSRQVSENTFLLKTLYGTPLYLSPEIVSGREYNEKTDIWSLGIVLYELCALVTPFHGKSLLALATAINEGKLDPIPAVYSQDMRGFITWLLTMDYNNRPSIAQVVARREEMKKQALLPPAPDRVVAARRPLRARQVVPPALPVEEEDSVADTESGDECDSGDSLSEIEPRRSLVSVQYTNCPALDGSRNRNQAGKSFSTRDISKNSGGVQPLGRPTAGPLQPSQSGVTSTEQKEKTKCDLLISVNPTNDGGSADGSYVSVNRDRLQACIRRNSLLLRKLAKMRTFAGPSGIGMDEEYRRLTSLLVMLDHALASGKMLKTDAQSLELIVAEHPERSRLSSPPGNAEQSLAERALEGISYAAGSASRSTAKRNSGPDAGVAVQVLDYFKPRQLKKGPFTSAHSAHQLFGAAKKLGTESLVDMAHVAAAPPLRVEQAGPKRPQSASASKRSHRMASPVEANREGAWPSKEQFESVNKASPDPSVHRNRRPHSASVTAAAKRVAEAQHFVAATINKHSNCGETARPDGAESEDPFTSGREEQSDPVVYRAQRRQRRGINGPIQGLFADEVFSNVPHSLTACIDSSGTNRSKQYELDSNNPKSQKKIIIGDGKDLRKSLLKPKTFNIITGSLC